MSAGQPKITPRRSKGSVVSTTYEFPRQAEKKTLGQLIYDGENGKVFGRTPKNWGKKKKLFWALRGLLELSMTISRLARASAWYDVCAPNQHLKSRKYLLNLFLSSPLIVRGLQGWSDVCSRDYESSRVPWKWSHQAPPDRSKLGLVW